MLLGKTFRVHTGHRSTQVTYNAAIVQRLGLRLDHHIAMDCIRSKLNMHQIDSIGNCKRELDGIQKETHL